MKSLNFISWYVVIDEGIAIVCILFETEAVVVLRAFVIGKGIIPGITKVDSIVVIQAGVIGKDIELNEIQIDTMFVVVGGCVVREDIVKGEI